MSVFDLFSKKQKRLRGQMPEVYKYDALPQPLRVQAIHIIKDAIGVDAGYGGPNAPRKTYEFVHRALCREYGLFSLGKDAYPRPTDEESLFTFLLQPNDVEKHLDVIQLFFQYIDRIIREDVHYNRVNSVGLSPDGAIEEINERFKEHGVGYQFTGSEIIRVDSLYTHSEIVVPTIALLWSKKFKGANEEYLKAHEHYRHGRNKECLSECLKSFESVMKIICKEKGWQHNDTDTSKKLIQVCFQNGLVPTFTQNQFTSLQNLLESGIPTIRNKLGGHGQGQVPQKVDNEMTRYALNLTGTNIIFLVEQSDIK